MNYTNRIEDQKPELRWLVKQRYFASLYLNTYHDTQYLCVWFGNTYNCILERTSLSNSFGINLCSPEQTRYNLYRYGWYYWLYGIQYLLRSAFNVYIFNFYLVHLFIHSFIHSFIQIRSLLSSPKRWKTKTDEIISTDRNIAKLVLRTKIKYNSWNRFKTVFRDVT